MSKNTRNRILLTAVAALLLVVMAVGGTVAYLVDKTSDVVNTFTPSKVDIVLTESANLDLKMVPGDTITKDPLVTVIAGNEACYVFVKMDKSDNFDNFMTYDMAEGWTLVSGETDVYYKTVAASETNTALQVIANDTVTVKATVTNQMLNENFTNPTLTITAYAVQQLGFENNVAGAWAEAEKTSTVIYGQTTITAAP